MPKTCAGAPEDPNRRIERDELEKRLQEALAVIEQLKERIRELEAQLGQNSSNSSKPPSSDPPWKPPKKRGKGKRKRGGQRGHKGSRRALVNPDEVVTHVPEQCRACGDALHGTDPSPQRHQVAEVPEVVVRVTEHQLHALRCSGCGTRTRASVPGDVSRSAFGPRVQAIVATLSGAFRLSKRMIVELMRDLFGVSMSLGSVSNLERATSEALAPVHETVLAQVRKAPVVHADETGWREGRETAWLWTAVTRTSAAFLIRDSRGAASAQELVGRSFPGVLVTDQYNGYHWTSDARRQLCWAHLLRRFQALVDRGGDAKEFGDACFEVAERLFDIWHPVHQRKVRRRTLAPAMEPVMTDFAALLRRGQHAKEHPVKVLCQGLLQREQSLWTFVRRRGVEPTNNHAERALRHGVIWRKTSFGTDSPDGSRFVERVLTVVGTLRLRARNILRFLEQACRAARSGAPAPALPTATR